MATLDDEWINYLRTNGIDMSYERDIEIVEPEKIVNEISIKSEKNVSHDYDLSISTKTEKLFLNDIVDINEMFWKIPIVEYWIPNIGVIKKQMKVVSKTIEEYEEYRKKLTSVRFYEEIILKEINNPSARSIKFKDERKITIGLSKKDIMTYRAKKKNAFYNCFAMVLRVKYEDVFREIHVKIFNTGKMEIPGVVNKEIFDLAKEMIIKLLRELQPEKNLDFIENMNTEHVLINSNFNCGFFIHRDKLHNILISEKYRIESSYDSCSYPGVKCKYYFRNEVGFDSSKQFGCVLKEDNELKMSELYDCKKYTEVSFMVFRTGSCLVVGNCSEKMIRFIFDFIKKLLTDEYENIFVEQFDEEIKTKRIKLRRKNITCSSKYFQSISQVC
jgi:hypothetical protein